MQVGHMNSLCEVLVGHWLMEAILKTSHNCWGLALKLD